MTIVKILKSERGYKIKGRRLLEVFSSMIGEGHPLFKLERKDFEETSHLTINVVRGRKSIPLTITLVDSTSSLLVHRNATYNEIAIRSSLPRRDFARWQPVLVQVAEAFTEQFNQQHKQIAKG